MYLATNKFGTSQMFTDEDILKDGSKIYIFNCACLTIHSETLGWANKHNKYTQNQDSMKSNLGSNGVYSESGRQFVADISYKF